MVTRHDFDKANKKVEITEIRSKQTVKKRTDILKSQLPFKSGKK